MKDERWAALKKQYDRLLEYMIGSGERLGIERHGDMHLKGTHNIWFVFPYQKAKLVKDKDDIDSKRIRLFWDFMDGEKKYFPYFYMVYLRAIRQVLWITKAVGRFEIATVPKSDPEALNPVADICKEIAAKERFILGRAMDGTDLLKRVSKLQPVHLGGEHTVEELEKSMTITRPLRAQTIILADDLVFSGKSIDACRRILMRAGARKVYAICLYGYKRR